MGQPVLAAVVRALVAAGQLLLVLVLVLAGRKRGR